MCSSADVKDIKLVINYELPNDIDSYVHRIGRTARGVQALGTSISLFTPKDRDLANDLVKILRDVKQVRVVYLGRVSICQLKKFFGLSHLLQSVPEQLLQLANSSRGNSDPRGFRANHGAGRRDGARGGGRRFLSTLASL